VHFLEKKSAQFVVCVGVAFAILAVDACSGGGGSLSGPMPQRQPLTPTARTVALTLPPTGVSKAALPSVGGFSETISFPANNAPSGTTLTLTISTQVPSSMPALASAMEVTQPLLDLTLSSNENVALQNYPGFSMTMPSSVHLYGAPMMMGFYDPTNGWKYIGNLTLVGSTATFTPSGSTSITFNAGVKYYAITYTCGTPSPSPSPSVRLFVTNLYNSTVTEYDQNGNRITPSATSPFANLNGPYGIAFDSSNSHLYVGNGGNNTITEYDQNGNQITPSATIPFPNLNDPVGIAFDSSNDHLYVTNNGDSTVTEYDQNGNQITPSAITPFANLNGPVGIAFDSSNDHLYVPNFNNNTMTEYDQNGNQITPSATIPFPSVHFPYGIAFDSSNSHLYVTNDSINAMTEYDQNGNQITPSAATPFPDLNAPGGLAFDSSNGHLYVTNLGSPETITVYDQNGNQISPSATTPFPNLSEPIGITTVP
jgi:DNA-binding beta-propeller fold protein YncE